MERRKFLLGMGAVAAGGTAAIGTGAVESFKGNRDMTFATVRDNNAYYQLVDNPPYSTYDGKQLNISLDRLNSHAVSTIDDVFGIRNSRPQTMDVWVTHSSFGNALTFEDSSSGDGVEGRDEAQSLDPGEVLWVAVTANVNGVEAEQDPITITIRYKEPSS
jgi:hypothetical protein